MGGIFIIATHLYIIKDLNCYSINQSLYDPEVERRRIKQGRIEGRLKYKNIKAIKVAENLLKLEVSENIIVQSTELSIDTVK